MEVVQEPPVQTEFFTPDGAPAEGYALVVSALVPYKRIEIAMDACVKAGLPLKIVGAGPERGMLERQATPNTTFLGRMPDPDLHKLYNRASVVLLPGEEDFGIVPLEAQACGRPVVALNRGGALETVVPGHTGVLVDEMSADAFAAGIAEVLRTRYDRGAIRAHAQAFGRDRFGDEIVRAIRAAAGLRTPIIALPDGLGRLQARFAELLPGKPFSLDNFRSLRTDSVGTVDGYAALGIAPQALTPWLPVLLNEPPRQRRLAAQRRRRR